MKSAILAAMTALTLCACVGTTYAQDAPRDTRRRSASDVEHEVMRERGRRARRGESERTSSRSSRDAERRSAHSATILRRDADSVIDMLGRPLLDIREGPARKLQFGNADCVLDAYLYPPEDGRGDPTVTYAEARHRDGTAMELQECMTRLRR